MRISPLKYAVIIVGGIAINAAVWSGIYAQITNPGVQQQGNVTPTHCAIWAGNGAISDGGATCAGSAPVQSVFGRIGVVVAAANDYAFNQISGFLGAGQLPAFTGDVTSPQGSSVNTLATVNPNVGSFGGVNSIPSFTVDGKGRITAAAANVPAIPFTELTGSLACVQLPALTGDISTTAGSCATLLPNVNSNVGSFGSATQSAVLTVNAKGQVTAASAVNITPAFSSITGIISIAQFPFLNANSIWLNATNASAQPTMFTVPACANDGLHALVYVNGTGLLCETLSAGGTLTGVTGSGLAVSTGGAPTPNIAVPAAAKSDEQAGTSAILATTPSQQQQHDSAAKAWCLFVGATAGTNSCVAGYNITSITRASAGTYTATFTTAFASANYGCTGTNMSNALLIVVGGVISSRTATIWPFFTVNAADAATDPVEDVFIECFGRQ